MTDRTIGVGICPLPLCLCLLLLFTMIGTGGCATAPKPEIRSIRADFSIKIKDPFLKALATATELVELDATGEFAPGTYQVNNTSVTVGEGTTFHLTLALPIKNPQLISTEDASGQLQTSQPLQVSGVSMPQSIVLRHGQVSGEVDLVRMMASFFVNMLQLQTLNKSEGGEMRQMIRTMHIATATLNLRPDATLAIAKNHFHIAKDSLIKLTDLDIAQNLDYLGLCLIKLAFLKDSAYIEEKVDAAFNGGSINDSVVVERKNSVLSLSPIAKHQAPRMTLEDCTYKFGRQKACTAHCDTSLITINKFDWARSESGDTPSKYHFDTSMNVSGTHLLLDYPTYSVDAIFPKTEPATLQAFNDSTGHSLDFATHEVLARTADIKIKRPTTSIDLQLTDAQLGKISFAKSGDVSFYLSEGNSGLKALQWSNGKRTFKLETAGGSSIAITKGMVMALSTNHAAGKVQGTIPISIKLGNASLANARGNVLDFDKLNGKIVVDLDKEVELNGAADFSIAQCKLFGDKQADVKVRGFKLIAGAEKAVMSLTGCSIVVPRGTIASMVKKQIPDEKVFDLNQEIFEEKKWRYKHGMITKLIVRKAKVQNLTLVGPDKASFDVGGDIEVEGTVDKTGLLAAFKKDAKKWETRHWSASSPCSGSGSITFSLIPNKNLADSDLKYTVNLQLPLPQNIDIDWGDVSKGLVRKAETSVISSYLNKCTPFHGTRTVPLDHTGSMKLFDGNTKLQSIKITKFGLKPTPEGTEIDFVGEATL